MATPKKGSSTPKSRALARSSRQAQSATKRAAVYGTPKIQEAGIPLALLAAMGARAAVPAARRLLQSRAVQKPPANRSLKDAAKAGDAKAKKPGKPPASRPMMTTADGRRVSDNASNRAMDAAARALKKGNVKGAQKSIDRAAGRPKYGKGTIGKK
jgi:hypothetical protein